MLPLSKFEKNRMARFRELDLILDFVYILTDNWLGDGVGPFPLLKRPKFPKKRRPPRSRESVAIGFWRYFRRKAGAPPAYGRRAWSKVVSYLRVFRYVFR